MTIEKLMDWSIPFSVIFFIVIRIPPVLIKQPICESCHLCEKIKHAFKNQKECKHTKRSHW